MGEEPKHDAIRVGDYRNWLTLDSAAFARYLARPSELKPCVVIPCFNHARTAVAVAQAALPHCPVIIIDDGSPVPVADVPGCHLIRLKNNVGKGAALRAGFLRAAELGFSHAITIDADGQHDVADLPKFLEAAAAHPRAMIAGARDFRAAGCPTQRRRANALSTFCFRMMTGVRLTDSQCGFRCYPLALVKELRSRWGGFAFELEFLARAAWLETPILPVPIKCSYAPEQLRGSNFRAIRDLTHIALMILFLFAQSGLALRLLRKGRPHVRSRPAMAG